MNIGMQEFYSEDYELFNREMAEEAQAEILAEAEVAGATEVSEEQIWEGGNFGQEAWEEAQAEIFNNYDFWEG